MTVRDLIELLQQFPPDVPVELWASEYGEDDTPKPEFFEGKIML